MVLCIVSVVLFEQNGIMSPMNLAIVNWFSCNINACPFSRSPALAELPSLTVLIHCRQVWELLNIGWNLKLVIVWFILGLSGIQLLVPWFIGGFSSILLRFGKALKESVSAESYRLHPPEHISDQWSLMMGMLVRSLCWRTPPSCNAKASAKAFSGTQKSW